MSFHDRSPFLFKPPEEEEEEQQRQQSYPSQQQLHYQSQHQRQHSNSHHQHSVESQLAVGGQLNPLLLSHPSFSSSNVPSPLLTPNAYDSLPTSANSLDFVIPSPSSLEQLSAGLMTPSDDQCSPFGSTNHTENGRNSLPAATTTTTTGRPSTGGQIHHSNPATGFIRPVQSSFDTEIASNPKLPSSTNSINTGAGNGMNNIDGDGDDGASAAVPWELHQQSAFSFPLPPPQQSGLPAYYPANQPVGRPSAPTPFSPPPDLSSDSSASVMGPRPGTAPAASALVLMSQPSGSSQTLAPSPRQSVMAGHPDSSPGGPIRYISTNPGQDNHSGFGVDQADGVGGSNSSSVNVSQLALNPNAYRHSLPEMNPVSYGFSPVLTDGQSPRLLTKSLDYLHGPSPQFFYQQQEEQQQPTSLAPTTTTRRTTTATSNTWPGQQQQQQSILFNLDSSQSMDASQEANGSFQSNVNARFSSAYPNGPPGHSPTIDPTGSDSRQIISRAQPSFLQSQQQPHPHPQQQQHHHHHHQQHQHVAYPRHQYQHQHQHQLQHQHQHQHQPAVRYNPYGGVRPRSKDSVGPFDRWPIEGEHAGNRMSTVGHPGASTSRPQTSDGISENYHYGHPTYAVGSIEHPTNGFVPTISRPSTMHSSSVTPFDNGNNASSSPHPFSCYPATNSTGVRPDGTFAYRPSFPSSNGLEPFGHRLDSIPLSVLDVHRRPMTSPSVSSTSLPLKATLGPGRRGRSQSNAQPGSASVAAAVTGGGLKKTKHKAMNTIVKPFEPLPLELRPISLVTGKPKRPRRKHDQVERLYACEFEECGRSYGTLNHLNTHIISQNHGEKRTPAEFRELRRIWRRKRKEEAAKNASLEKEPATGNQKKRKSSGNNSVLSGINSNGEDQPRAGFQLRKDSIVSASSYGKESDDHSSAEEEGYDDDDDDDRPRTFNGDSFDVIGESAGANGHPPNSLDHHRFSLSGAFQAKASVQNPSESARSIDPYAISATNAFDPSLGSSNLGTGGEPGVAIGMSMSMSAPAEPSPFSWSVPDPFTPPMLMGFQPFGGVQTAQGGQLVNQASHMFGIF